MWHTVLFDLDGTLTDPKIGITLSIAHALKHFGINADPDELTCFIGPPLVDAFMEFYLLTRQQSMEAIRIFRERFSSVGWAENEPYPGIRDLLSALRHAGKHLLVATSKPEAFAVRILEHFMLAKYFDHICGAPMDESDAGRKENVIKSALSRAGIEDPSGVIMVGDRKHDIIGAHMNALPAVGVLYGYGSRDELTSAGAEYITESIQSLESLLIHGR